MVSTCVFINMPTCWSFEKKVKIECRDGRSNYPYIMNIGNGKFARMYNIREIIKKLS